MNTPVAHTGKTLATLSKAGSQHADQTATSQVALPSATTKQSKTESNDFGTLFATLPDPAARPATTSPAQPDVEAQATDTVSNPEPGEYQIVPEKSEPHAPQSDRTAAASNETTETRHAATGQRILANPEAMATGALLPTPASKGDATQIPSVTRAPETHEGTGSTPQGIGSPDAAPVQTAESAPTGRDQPQQTGTPAVVKNRTVTHAGEYILQSSHAIPGTTPQNAVHPTAQPVQIPIPLSQLTDRNSDAALAAARAEPKIAKTSAGAMSPDPALHDPVSEKPPAPETIAARLKGSAVLTKAASPHAIPAQIVEPGAQREAVEPVAQTFSPSRPPEWADAAVPASKAQDARMLLQDSQRGAAPLSALPQTLAGGLTFDLQSKLDSAHSLLTPSDTPELLTWDPARAPFTPQGATAPLRADLAPHIARQLGEVMGQASHRPTEIALSPQELGRVRMSVVAEDGAITVNILAERPETLDLMRRHIDQLGQTFKSMGYESINFEFGQGADSGENASAGQNDGQRSGPDGSQRPETSPIAAQSGVIHLNATPLRGVDIRL